MTPEEERALFDELRATGSPDARNRLIAEFLPVALAAASRFRKSPRLRCADRDDVDAEAALCLIACVDGHNADFDFTRTVRMRVRRWLIDWLCCEAGRVTMPPNARRVLSQFSKTKQSLADAGEPADDDAVIAAMRYEDGQPCGEKRKGIAKSCVHLAWSHWYEGGTVIGDSLTVLDTLQARPDDPGPDEDARRRVEKLLRKVTPGQRDDVRSVFGIGRDPVPQTQVARRRGVSPQTVSHGINRALATMRDAG